ncbi:hypothetical protein [Algoriphagus confluentis]|uniref:Lipoprotein n=1 Tax=Algoriphagus confluentis TaxID=1697556 RepID=A0ABQ6PQY1_9BACT|nr:hypothetical protein Aconfl_25800 [Algoriphagus confluentis]
MKPTYLSLAKISVLAGLFLISACSSEEDANPTDQLNDTEETSQEMDLTATLEDVDEVALTGFQRNGFTDRTLVTLEEDLCERVKIEWLPNEKKMIIDFGEGCTSPRGVTRKGKIIVSYTGRYWAPGTVITTTFENYYVDDRKIEGIRVLTNEGFNANDRFFTFKTVVEGGKVTWPDGTFRTFESRQTKRVFLPNENRGIIYAVDGGSRGVNRKGNSYVVEITSPLIFAERCIRSGIRMPSEGVMLIRVETRGAIEIDFGSDTCDREVSITFNGTTRTVTLPRS